MLRNLWHHFLLITRHRHKVIAHCKKAGILWQGLRHDLSKYSPTEFIPGVKPGRKTMEFLDTIMSRITLPGSIFLGIVAILPAFATIAGVNQQFAQFYGGTSLLILVGVVLDTLQQIESHLLMRHYDGLMKTGRIKGKTPGGPAAY